MAYEVRMTGAVEKELKKLNIGIRNRLYARMLELGAEPRPSGVKKLEGEELYRVRVGDFRIIYAIRDKELLVLIVRVADRKEAYR
jgi:mRNA interferase RelE/StbE